MKRYISFVAVLAALFLLVGCSEPAPQRDDPNTNNPSGSSGNEDVDSTTATTQPKFVSKDSVKKASLLCAGVDESKVTKYKVELEYDDDSKRWEYEVTFNVGRIEYEILINAVSGELLNVEREIDD